VWRDGASGTRERASSGSSDERTGADFAWYRPYANGVVVEKTAESQECAVSKTSFTLMAVEWSEQTTGRTRMRSVFARSTLNRSAPQDRAWDSPLG